VGEVWGETVLVQLLVLAFAAVAARLLVDRVERWLRLPSVVVEIVLGSSSDRRCWGWCSRACCSRRSRSWVWRCCSSWRGMRSISRAVLGRPITLAALGWVLSFAVAAEPI
jgi:hypothetical protein